MTHRQHLIVYQGADFDAEDLTLQFWESIQLRESAAASSTATTLKVYRTPFSIASTTILQFTADEVEATVSSTASLGATSIAINSLSASLAKGAIALVRKLDLTGSTARAKIRKKFEDTAELASFTVAIASPATDGIVTLALSSTVTAALQANCTFADISEDLLANLQDESRWSNKLKSAAYVWDLEIISGSGVVKRRAEGWVLVPREVTR